MATNSWHTAVSGVGARASQLNQLLNALTQAQDIGQGAGLYQPIANPGALTATVSSTSGNLTGAYTWVVVFVTGGTNAAGGYFPSGNTTAAGTISNTVTPSAQEVDLSAIPLGPTGTIGRDLYRTKAGGSTYYYLDTIQDNTTTTYTDNTADSSLGTATAPTVNTTGTPWSVPVYPAYPGFNGTTGAIAGQVVTGGTTAPIWWDGVHWQQIPLWTTANIWTTAQTFNALATFSAGITGTGSTGNLTAGSGILNTANTWETAQTITGGLTSNGNVHVAGSSQINFDVNGGSSNAFVGNFKVSSGSTFGFSITDSGLLWVNVTTHAAYTLNNTLDNGSGNASVAGTQTVTGLATFSAGITGTGSVGSLTVPWGNLTSVPSLVNTLTAGSGISLSATSGSPTITNSGVLSFNGRTGAVDPASGDYTFAEIADTATNAQLAGPLVDSLTSDASTLTITNPSGVGAANADLNLANANTWTATQTYEAGTAYTASGAAGSYTWQYDSTLNSLQLVYTAS